MAFLFGDSFDHYATADIATKWTSLSQSGSGAITIGSGNGRTKNGLQIVGSNNAIACVKYTTGTKTTLFVGFAFKASAAAGLEICSFYSNATLQFALRLNSDGTLGLYQSHFNNLLQNSTIALSTNTFYYIEIQAKFSTSTALGDVTVKVNQTTAISLAAGSNTDPAASGSASVVVIGQSQSYTNTGSTNTYDDLYICDDSGSVCNTFLGDITVDACYASVAGNYQDFTLVGAATSVLCVGDQAPDGDTTYVKSNSLTNRESFTFTTTSFSITNVFAVQAIASARQFGTGLRNLTPFVRIGITNYENAAVAIATSYAYIVSVYMTNPSTGIAWTSSDISTLEAGVKVS